MIFFLFLNSKRAYMCSFSFIVVFINAFGAALSYDLLLLNWFTVTKELSVWLRTRVGVFKVILDDAREPTALVVSSASTLKNIN